jgi:hypothetical protein
VTLTEKIDDPSSNPENVFSSHTSSLYTYLLTFIILLKFAYLESITPALQVLTLDWIILY